MKSSIWPSGFWDLTEWFQNIRIWPSGCSGRLHFKCFRYNDIPGDYLGSFASLADSGAKGDLRKVRIGVRVGARDSFQKQATPEPLGQILIFWNHSGKSSWYFWTTRSNPKNHSFKYQILLPLVLIVWSIV